MKQARMNGFVLALALGSAIALTVGLAGGFSALQQPQRQDASQEKAGEDHAWKHAPPIMVWDECADLLATLHFAFLQLGCERQGEASSLSKIAYDAINPIGRPNGKGTLDWRKTDPRTVFRDAFVAVGIEPEDAMGLAVTVLDEMNVKRFSADGNLEAPFDPAQLQVDREHLEEVVEARRGVWKVQLEKRRQERRTAKPTLRWAGGSLASKLDVVFLYLGAEAQEAADLAQIAYDELNPIERPGGTLDWHNANPYRVVEEALLAVGYPRDEAFALSVGVLTEMGLRRPVTGEITEEEKDQCWVYPVRIIWCDGENKRSDVYHINGLVWEDVKACPKPASYICNETDWYTMHSSGGCGGSEPFPIQGTCLWIGEIDKGKWRDCDLFTLQRGCFIELDPATDCENINFECGDRTGGPDGCPCDG